jgi:molecular chaperone GrpE
VSAERHPDELSQPRPAEREGPAAPSADDRRSSDAALAEMEDRWRRALADLDNVRKRHQRELEQARAGERELVAAEWLPVVDNLELALAHAGADPTAIIEGVRAVRDMAVGVLGSLGFARYDEVGGAFDPARHEAVGTTAREEVAPGTVVGVVRPGYGNGERLLRPAAVIVATREGS